MQKSVKKRGVKMKNSKSKLLTTVVLLTIILAAFGIQRLSATNYTDVTNYCWVEGVFHSDSYALYPYAQESLDVGFSKYGEMIGYNEATQIGLGLQYPGYASAGNTYDQTDLTSVDPFANEEIDVDVWMNGWFMDIKYRKATGEWREIWAFALFSDAALHGGSWIKMTSSTDPYVSYRPLWQEFPPYANPDSDTYPAPKPSYGGRKSNGDCVTDSITIVYNGPRKYVAVMKTRISDGATGLVDVFFTLIFNKADKNVIVLKDVKRLYDKGPLNIQFGNRGEWDLSPPEYVHFYTDEPVTSWDVDNDGSIDPDDEGHEFFFGYMTGTDPISGNKAPKKWWDEIPESEYPTDVEGVPFNCSTYPFNEWFETQETCYGREWHTDKNIKEHSYAVAQVIDDDTQYVGALAVWPHPEFWSVQNSFVNPYAPPATIPLMLSPISRMLEWHRWLVDEDPISDEYPNGRLADRNNTWIKVDDMSFEPDIPFIIYEHDFKLQLGVADIYRIVSVYVVTDWHDADDHDANDLDGDGVVENKIDREVQYQLDEIFDPYDIYDAMHQNTKRWVQFFDRDYEGRLWNGLDYYIIELDPERTIETGDRIPSLPVYRGDRPWDAYCDFSERVLVNTGTGYQLIWPHDDGLTHDPPPRDDVYDDYHMLDPIPYENTGVNTPYYTISLTTGIISFYEWDDAAEEYLPWHLPTGSIVKVEWSSEHHATTAGQWDEDDALYPIDGDTYRFPLHHDIIDAYKNDTEVFIIEQLPVRILEEGERGQGSPYYTFTASMTKANITIYDSGSEIAVGWEIDVKYWKNDTEAWVEKKFIRTAGSSQKLQLDTASNYTEKVWYHSEKAITGGDYVFNNATKKLYLQDPLAVGQWLFVNYTSGVTYYEDWFYGYQQISGVDTHAWDRNVFTLRAYPNVGTLRVFNTKIVEEIINETCYGVWPYGTVTNGVWHNKTLQYAYKPDGTKGPPSGVKCPVPDESYAGLPEYRTKTWVKYGIYSGTKKYEECEWINMTEEKVRGNYIIRETSSCDELVLDQAPLNDTQTLIAGWPGQELKIVYKVPSGRWEWGTVGKTAASVDSLGIAMVTAAFKNKLIEFGIGGLDIQDTANGPRVPWLVAGTADSLGRYHLYDDWCYSRTGDANAKTTSWPITSSNIITVGGTDVNMLAKYSNDWVQALITTAPEKIYSVTCWDRDTYTGGSPNDRYGYAIIATYKDKNGTAVLLIHGWTGQDTYYACKWFDVNKYWLQHLNLHVTDLVLKIDYKYDSGAIRCVPYVTIVEKLGTISEKPQHDP
jgi:hypothetical protein